MLFLAHPVGQSLTWADGPKHAEAGKHTQTHACKAQTDHLQSVCKRHMPNGDISLSSTCSNSSCLDLCHFLMFLHQRPLHKTQMARAFSWQGAAADGIPKSPWAGPTKDVTSCSSCYMLCKKSLLSRSPFALKKPCGQRAL